MSENLNEAYPAMQTTYAQEQENLRRLRQDVAERIIGVSWHDSIASARGIITLANVSGMMIEEYPNLRYFSYSVISPVEGVRMVLPGAFFDAEENSLNEDESESLSALLCELTDDDDTIASIAGFSKMIDALKISQWEPMDGIEAGLEVLEGVES